jgi:hypothetical protein
MTLLSVGAKTVTGPPQDPVQFRLLYQEGEHAQSLIESCKFRHAVRVLRNGTRRRCSRRNGRDRRLVGHGRHQRRVGNHEGRERRLLDRCTHQEYGSQRTGLSCRIGQLEHHST